MADTCGAGKGKTVVGCRFSVPLCALSALCGGKSSSVVRVLRPGSGRGRALRGNDHVRDLAMLSPAAMRVILGSGARPSACRGGSGGGRRRWAGAGVRGWILNIHYWD